MLFKQLYRIKPPSSRKESPELFYLGKGYQSGLFFKEIAQADPKNMNFEVFIEKYLNKVKTREDTGFSSGMAIRDTIKSMYHILRSSDIKRKLFLVEIGPLKLLVFENDQELFNAILYNPVAENIHYSTKNTKSGEDEGMPFEDFIEQHKDDYTYAQ